MAGENEFDKALQQVKQGRVAQPVDLFTQALMDIKQARNPQPIAPTPNTDEHWLSRTAGRMGAQAALVTSQVLDTVGLNYDYASDYWKQKILENPRDTQGLSQAWNDDQFGKFLVETIGDSLGYMFPSLVAGALVAPAGAAVGANLALRAGPMLPQALTAARAAGSTNAALAGAFAVNANTQAYETADMLREQGLTPTALNVLPAAGAKAALDTFALGKMAGALGLGRFFSANAAKEIERRGLLQILKDDGFKAALAVGGKEVGKVAGIEGITEATQEAIDVGLVATLKDESLWSAYPREMQRIVEAGLTGALVGGVFGGVGAAMPQATPQWSKEEREKAIADLANKVMAQTAERQEKLRQLKDQGVLDPKSLGVGTVVDYSTMGDVYIPGFGEEGVVTPIGGITPSNTPLTSSGQDATKALQAVTMRQTVEQGLAAGDLVEEETSFLSPQNMALGFADYPNVEIKQNWNKQDGPTREQAKQTVEYMLQQETRDMNDVVYGMRPTQTGLTATTTVAGVTRPLYNASVNVSSKGRVTVTVDKLDRVPLRAVEALVKNTVAAARDLKGQEVFVKMPKNSQRIWKQLAQAHGALVEKDGFRIPLKKGELFAGQPVVSADKVSVGGQVVSASPDVISTTAVNREVLTFNSVVPTTLPAQIEVDGRMRPTTNANGQQIATSRAGVEAFWRWFGASVTVDENGRPKVFYHGTSKDQDFKKFNVGARGAFFTESAEGASQYASDNDSMNTMSAIREGKHKASRVIPVYLKVERIRTLNATEQNEYRFAKSYITFQKVMAQKARYEGFDAIDYNDGALVVLADTQIKSVYNTGTFNATPVINASQDGGTPTPVPGVFDPGFEYSEVMPEHLQMADSPLGVRAVRSLSAELMNGMYIDLWKNMKAFKSMLSSSCWDTGGAAYDIMEMLNRATKNMRPLAMVQERRQVSLSEAVTDKDGELYVQDEAAATYVVNSIPIVTQDVKDTERMLQKAVENWRKQFMPHANIILSLGANPHGSTHGWAMTGYDPQRRKTYHVIGLNLVAGGATKLGDPKSVYSLRTFMTAAHEFGHLLHSQYWWSAPAELREAVVAEMQTRRNKFVGKTFEQFARELNPVGTKYSRETWAAANWKFYGSKENGSDMDMYAAYLHSDVEQFAELMADALTKDMFRSNSVIWQYVAKWRKSLSDFMRAIGFKKKVVEQKAFQDFYRWLWVEGRKNINAIEAGPRMDFSGTIYGKVASAFKMADPVPNELAGQITRAADLNIRGFGWMKHVLNMPQLVDRFKVPALEVYWGVVKKMKILKNEIIGEADQIAHEYYNIKGGKEARKNISKFIYWLNDHSELLERRLSDEEIIRLATGVDESDAPVRLNETEVKFVLKAQQSFMDVLLRMKHAMQVEAAFGVLPDARVDGFVSEWNAATTAEEHDAVLVKYTGSGIAGSNTEVVNKLLLEMRGIDARIAKMMHKNYAPKMRHGKYRIRLIATEDMEQDGRIYKAGQTIFYEAHDSEVNRGAAARRMEIAYKGMPIKIELDVMNEQEASVASLPRAFIDAIKENEHLDLSASQKQGLEIMALEYSPSRSFTKHLMRREGILGYSDDFGRTYAAYMFRAAGYISKVQYGRQASYAIREFNRQKDTQLVPGIANNSGWTELKNFTENHFQHIMSPDNDYAQVRSFMSAWYLAFMPRSAWANLFQVPMATIPYLSNKYKDGDAWGAVMKAYATTNKMLRNEKVDPAIMAALERAMREQYIDASAIVELGAMGDSNWFDRTTGIDTQRIWTKWVIDRGFFLFRNAEKINRRVTFLAAFNLEYAKSKDANLAYDEAIKAIELTQFDMSKEARAQIFRGGKGILLMFNQHLFNMTYLATGGMFQSKAHLGLAFRVLAMSALLAGVEGMPWAGLGLDLFDLASKLYKQVRGEEYTYSDARADIREMVQALDMEPDLFMHGLTKQWGLGPLSFLSLFGVPNIDLSGSVNLGYPGSWAQMLKSTEGTPEERWQKTIESLGGPGYSIVHGIWKSIMDNNPNDWKRVESALPAIARAASQGARWTQQGGEVASNGAIIYPIGPENNIDAVFKMLGFTPTALSAKYEQYGMGAEAAAYWMGRKQTLLREHAYAVDIGDSEAIRMTRENIARYNAEVDKRKIGKGFKLTPQSIRRSIMMRRKAIERVEAGLAANKSQQQLLEQYQALFSQQPQGGPPGLGSTVWGGGQ